MVKLVQVRTETVSLFQRLESELRSQYEGYENTARTVDAISMVADIMVSMSMLVAKGMSAMKLTGAALEEANKDLGHDAIKFAFSPVRDPVLELTAGQIDANRSLGWALGKTVVESFLKMQTPSFWAAVVGNIQDGKSWSEAVTSDAGDILAQAIVRLHEQRNETLRALDARISQIQKDLGNTTVPGKVNS